jgi:hypothetical protein
MAETNTEIAEKIVTRLAEITHVGDGWRFNLLNAIGYDFVIGGVKTEKTATKDAISLIAQELKDGNLVLSEGWTKVNIPK